MNSKIAVALVAAAFITGMMVQAIPAEAVQSNGKPFKDLQDQIDVIKIEVEEIEVSVADIASEILDQIIDEIGGGSPTTIQELEDQLDELVNQICAPQEAVTGIDPEGKIICQSILELLPP